MKSFFNRSNIIVYLIIISSIVTLNFIWRSAIDLTDHVTLDERTRAKIIEWYIDEDLHRGYVIRASYDFEDKNHNKKQGDTIFTKQKYMNYYAALDGISVLSKKDLKVWYSKKDSKHSELDHSFKIKNLLYLAISLFVLVYFIIMNIRLKKSGY